MAGFLVSDQPKLRIKFIFPLGISLARDRGGQYIEAFTKEPAVTAYYEKQGDAR